MNIYAADREILIRFFALSGWTVAAREILHKACRKLEEKENQTIEVLDDITLD